MMDKVLLRTHRKHVSYAWGAAIGLLLIFSAPAHSNTIIFVTPSNAQVGGSPVDVQADFTLNSTTHQITITLLNLELNIQRDFQGISSIQVSLSNLSGNLTPTLAGSPAPSYSGIDVSDNSAPVSHPGLADTWTPTQSTATNLIFCTNCPGGGNNDLLIGGPDPGPGANTGTYHGGNPGLYGKSPFILASGATYSSGPLAGLVSDPTWTLNVPQLTASSTVTGVTFGFGTQWGSNITTGQDPAPAPEPGAGSLVFTGCFMVGLSVFFRQRRASLIRQPVSLPPGRSERERSAEG
jgi:hypothetical protein